jgi:tRNA (guanine37-N1)-methyltransferase
MFFDILTLFPDMFTGVFSDSIIKRAVEKKIVTIGIHNIREYSEDSRHKTVDDYPYGGDPGMVLKPEPLARAIKAVKRKRRVSSPKVIFLSPQGERLKHSVVEELLKENALILLCGRYKGVDQRIRDKYIDREISIGDYVLSGGEIPAMVCIDAITRLLPGTLGNNDSAQRDSLYNGLLAPPLYTRPELFEKMNVPEILLSGHHENIRTWQQKKAEEITRIKRPDLWEHYREKHETDSNNIDQSRG